MNNAAGRVSVVAKVGGSLYDWTELGTALRDWLRSLTEPRVLLFPGGGAAAECVRALDRTHRLGEEAAHWLAVRSLTLAAEFLGAVLTGQAVVVRTLTDVERAFQSAKVPVLDPFPFLQQDETTPGRLPHSWSVTSDSLSLRVAAIVRADRLILLKSAGCTRVVSSPMLLDSDLVDPYFAEAWRSGRSATDRPADVEIVNLRAWHALTG